MLVAMVVLIAQQFSQVEAVIIQILSVIMPLMHSTAIIRRIQCPVAVILEELLLLLAPIQVS
jgi:hypothetical protein